MTEHPALQQTTSSSSKGTIIRPSLRKKKDSATRQIDSSSQQLPCPHLETDSLDQEMGFSDPKTLPLPHNRQFNPAVRDFVVERIISHNTHQVPPTGTLETHLEFACMSQQEYEDHPEEYGSLLDTPKEEDPAIATEEDKEDFNRICDNEQDDLGDDVEEESVDNDVILDEPTLTPFIKLWRVLSQWMTHDTLTLLNTWEKNEIFESTMNMDHILYPTANDDPLTTTSQAEQQQTAVAARYQGLIAMLKIHLPTCIEVLGLLQYTSITYKGAEDRLGALVASFDLHSTDMTFTSMYLDSSILWRACTMILLDIACLCHDSRMDSHYDTRTIQTHIQTLGLSMEEYTYLTRQALKSLCTQYTTPMS